MNGYERIQAAMKGEKPDKIPVMLHNFMMAAKEAGVSMSQFRENPKNIADVFIKSVEKYEFDDQIDKLANADLLYLVSKKFTEIDLHPDHVSNADMGLIFEELIRKFAELSNETAGEHFTPREVIRLIQERRKSDGFDISDRINVRWSAPADLAKTIAAHTAHISEEVLALSMSEDAGVPEIESELGVNVALSKA